MENRRGRTIENFISAATTESDDREAENTALDALVVAHLAAMIEFIGGPHMRWQEHKESPFDGSPPHGSTTRQRTMMKPLGDELDGALDVLAITHIAATFEWASGALKW
jgi:hypothetical protein